MIFGNVYPFLLLVVNTIIVGAEKDVYTKQKPVNVPSQDDIDGLIIGGEPVKPPFKYPYMVFGNLCGASLISANVLLSAAHCAGVFDNVQIGRHDLNDNTEKYETFRVVEEVPHPLYDETTNDYDLMLLRIDGASTRKPVELDRGDTTLAPGQKVITMGWGRTLTDDDGTGSSILLEVKVKLWSQVKCNDAYEGGITDQMLCASSPGKDSCQGDSGGPLIDKSTGIQIGVVSWGAGCADPNYPGVYAKVSEQINWIQEYIESSMAPSSAPTPCDGHIMELEIETDDYPEDISWEVQNGAGKNVLEKGTGSYTIKNDKYYESVCLSTQDDCYEFTIADFYNDGICCGSGEGSYKLYFGGMLIKEGGEYASEEKTFFGNTCPVPTTIPSQSPTDVPICDNHCFDSSLTTSHKKSEKQKTCQWVEKNDEQRCKQYKTHCRRTCEMCDACEDSTKAFIYSDKELKCTKVEKKKNMYCKIPEVAFTCPFTCGMCTN